MPNSPRIAALAARDPAAARLVDDMLAISIAGLPAMWRANERVFGHSLRLRGEALELVGTSPRYTAIVAVGAADHSEDAQRKALSGATARELADSLTRFVPRAGLGDLALFTWACAATRAAPAPALAKQLVARLAPGVSGPTVEVAWALRALAAIPDAPGARETASRVCAALLAHSASGIFPHHVGKSGGLRAHVGCYADQVYPIQALAWWSRVAGDRVALAAAARCAERICVLQGAQGQWWWHYDARSGGLVEGYPVYSVHQDAMGPMALFDLAEAGGPLHLDAIARGLRWLEPAPELGRSMLDRERNLIWRKAARREPNKLTRAVRGVATGFAPGARLAMLDVLFPPGLVDAESRPYHLGWVLHAWPRSG
jgi:hypothetical protein